MVVVLAAVLLLPLDDNAGTNPNTTPNTGASLVEAGTVSLSGRARVVDGDTVRLNGQRVRILGIDAPEIKQTCSTKEGLDWACGQRAKQILVSLLANKTLRCQSSERDIYDRLLARCFVGDVDIGAFMVRQGLAVSYYDYRREESLASEERLGLWQGEFVKPRAWRDARK